MKVFCKKEKDKQIINENLLNDVNAAINSFLRPEVLERLAKNRELLDSNGFFVKRFQQLFRTVLDGPKDLTIFVNYKLERNSGKIDKKLRLSVGLYINNIICGLLINYLFSVVSGVKINRIFTYLVSEWGSYWVLKRSEFNLLNLKTATIIEEFIDLAMNNNEVAFRAMATRNHLEFIISLVKIVVQKKFVELVEFLKSVWEKLKNFVDTDDNNSPPTGTTGSGFSLFGQNFSLAEGKTKFKDSNIEQA